MSAPQTTVSAPQVTETTRSAPATTTVSVPQTTVSAPQTTRTTVSGPVSSPAYPTTTVKG
ncbi:hypothetical protein GCM10018954_007830 [Kutzneria kofuensis]